MGRLGTTAAADFCAHGSGLPPTAPPFGQALLAHYAAQTSPNKNVNFRCASSPTNAARRCPPWSVSGTVSLSIGSSPQHLSGPRMAFLFVASQLWREWDRRRQSGRRLRTHSQASFPRSVALPQLPSPRTCLVGLHLVSCPPINSRFRPGDLHPTSSRPCRAYDATEPRSRPAAWRRLPVAAG
jgi:hypothetical protein